jgi:hypothetical protein
MKASGGSNGPTSMSTSSTTTSTKADSFRRVEVITGVGRRRRWTDEEEGLDRGRELDRRPRSRRWPRYGLHASQLFTWRQQLAAPVAHEAPEFLPVVVTEGAATPAEPAGRWRSRSARPWCGSAPDVDAAALRRVLEVLRGLRDRGPARGAHPLGGPAGRLPQRAWTAGGSSYSRRSAPTRSPARSSYFRPRRTDRVKILVYDGTGLVLYRSAWRPGGSTCRLPAEGWSA